MQSNPFVRAPGHDDQGRERVLARLDELLAELPQALIDLLAIPSLGGTAAEADAQRHLAKRWRGEGFDVDEWDIDVTSALAAPDFPGQEVERVTSVGVIATLRGNGAAGRTLLFNGHTDVVPPGDPQTWQGDAFTPRIEDVAGHPSLIARGACDMKAGVVAMWFAARAIAESGVRLQGDLILAPVVGEEDGGLGTYSLIKHGVRADACVIPEPTNLDIIPANGGALTFRLYVPGLATHASRRDEGVSAIEKLLHVMPAITSFETIRNADVDPLMERWSIAYPISIGTVHAGDWASTVPDLAIAEGRLGVALGETTADARAAFEAMIAATCAEDPWLADHPVRVEWWGGQFASGRTDPGEPIIELVSSVHAELTGATPAIYGGPYGSDLRLLVGLAGIPTVQYGPGDAKDAHAPNEHVRIADVETCARALALIALDFCGIA